ncbi:hypothetical protein M2282_003251 [Variovorax boronicumulans]|uniref:hypothetical protein n=1 Tax=Variovorax boronicumulans TaxID=436515 RepID=UPI002476F7A2|nr:hypothetical protein [Variovorax boronicumulans]MDH6168100.1 hypothetical protein [Variovorax boronicumulans]
MSEQSPFGPATPTSTPQLFQTLIKMPLYGAFDLDGKTKPSEQVREVRISRTKFDDYCPRCEKHTTWTAVPLPDLEQRAITEKDRVAMAGAQTSSRPLSWMGDFVLRTACARNADHVANFYFHTKVVSSTPGAPLSFASSPFKYSIIKVGQFPSLTDFHLGDLSAFEEGMSKQQRREFVRATNTAAHGFNVAACVYYRRVFEGVLIEARDQYMVEKNMSDWPEFKSARTDERIRLLRDHLPKFMSEHPELYGILSLGVHELTEEQCEGELPILRKAIELIMSDKLMAARLKRDRDSVSKLVAQAVERHKR